MTAYAVAHLTDVDLNDEIVQYLHRIDATLEPFGGQFLIHGARAQVLEGSWPGHAILVSFPDLAAARAGTTPPPTRRSFRCGCVTARAR